MHLISNDHEYYQNDINKIKLNWKWPSLLSVFYIAIDIQVFMKINSLAV